MTPSELCLSCGLCCDGTLFSHVRLDTGEAAALRLRGVRIDVRSDGGLAVLQPCGALEGRRCRVYAERPQACQKLECMLTLAYAEGEVDAAEARSTVAEAHALLERLRQALPPGDGAEPPLRRARKLERFGASGAVSGAATALESFLLRHFLGRQPPR